MCILYIIVDGRCDSFRNDCFTHRVITRCLSAVMNFNIMRHWNSYTDEETQQGNKYSSARHKVQQCSSKIVGRNEYLFLADRCLITSDWVFLFMLSGKVTRPLTRHIKREDSACKMLWKSLLSGFLSFLSLYLPDKRIPNAYYRLWKYLRVHVSSLFQTLSCLYFPVSFWERL